MKIYKSSQLKPLKIFQPFLILIIFSCAVQHEKEIHIDEKAINTEVNQAYKESMQAFTGQLNQTELKQIREEIFAALNHRVPEHQTILINYYQTGTNCISFPKKKSTVKGQIKNSIELSQRFSRVYQAEDFFVYSKDAFHKEILEKQKSFIQDPGFFQQEIFTLQENCEAFFILKPSGEFMKYYGEDYYSHVEYFLKKK